MRIVSLLPAATEICFALGLGDDLVGVSPECDYPHAVREKPIVSHARLQYDGKTSGDTSRMVGERIRSGGALYQVDESALRASGPDLILTQGLCDVCAPTLGDVEDVARRLPSTPVIESLDPHRVEDMLHDILVVGRACGNEARPVELGATPGCGSWTARATSTDPDQGSSTDWRSLPTSCSQSSSRNYRMPPRRRG